MIAPLYLAALVGTLQLVSSIPVPSSSGRGGGSSNYDPFNYNLGPGRSDEQADDLSAFPSLFDLPMPDPGQGQEVRGIHIQEGRGGHINPVEQGRPATSSVGSKLDKGKNKQAKTEAVRSKGKGKGGSSGEGSGTEGDTNETEAWRRLGQRLPDLCNRLYAYQTSLFNGASRRTIRRRAARVMTDELQSMIMSGYEPDVQAAIETIQSHARVKVLPKRAKNPVEEEQMNQTYRRASELWGKELPLTKRLFQSRRVDKEEVIAIANMSRDKADERLLDIFKRGLQISESSPSLPSDQASQKRFIEARNRAGLSALPHAPTLPTMQQFPPHIPTLHLPPPIPAMYLPPHIPTNLAGSYVAGYNYPDYRPAQMYGPLIRMPSQRNPPAPPPPPSPPSPPIMSGGLEDVVGSANKGKSVASGSSDRSNRGKGKEKEVRGRSQRHFQS